MMSFAYLVQTQLGYGTSTWTESANGIVVLRYYQSGYEWTRGQHYTLMGVFLGILSPCESEPEISAVFCSFLAAASVITDSL